MLAESPLEQTEFFIGSFQHFKAGVMASNQLVTVYMEMLMYMYNRVVV